MPAALARLETVANRARGATGLGSAALATGGAGLRPAVPAGRAKAGRARATGTARVKPPGQPTGSASDVGPKSVSAARATGTAAPVPPRTGPPLTGLARRLSRAVSPNPSVRTRSVRTRSGRAWSAGPGQQGPVRQGSASIQTGHADLSSGRRRRVGAGRAAARQSRWHHSSALPRADTDDRINRAAGPTGPPSDVPPAGAPRAADERRTPWTCPWTPRRRSRSGRHMSPRRPGWPSPPRRAHPPAQPRSRPTATTQSGSRQHHGHPPTTSSSRSSADRT